MRGMVDKYCFNLEAHIPIKSPDLCDVCNGVFIFFCQVMVCSYFTMSLANYKYLTKSINEKLKKLN